MMHYTFCAHLTRKVCWKASVTLVQRWKLARSTTKLTQHKLIWKVFVWKMARVAAHTVKVCKEPFHRSTCVPTLLINKQKSNWIRNLLGTMNIACSPDKYNLFHGLERLREKISFGVFSITKCCYWPSNPLAFYMPSKVLERDHTQTLNLDAVSKLNSNSIGRITESAPLYRLDHHKFSIKLNPCAFNSVRLPNEAEASKDYRRSDSRWEKSNHNRFAADVSRFASYLHFISQLSLEICLIVQFAGLEDPNPSNQIHWVKNVQPQQLTYP